MSFISELLGGLLLFFYNLTGSYGIAIIILTIVFRLATFPLNLKQIKSTKAMNALVPERKKLEEKFKGDKEGLNKAMMELYAKHKINPLAGCLPLLIQMPIFIAMFRVIQDTDNFANTMFLGIDLARNASELGSFVGPILPILAGLTTYLQSKQSMADNPAAGQGGMGAMTTIMPLMIVFFSWSLPAGLALYWLVGNIFSITQHHFLNKKVDFTPQQGEA